MLDLNIDSESTLYFLFLCQVFSQLFSNCPTCLCSLILPFSPWIIKNMYYKRCPTTNEGTWMLCEILYITTLRPGYRSFQRQSDTSLMVGHIIIIILTLALGISIIKILNAGSLSGWCSGKHADWVQRVRVRSPSGRYFFVIFFHSFIDI